MAEITFAVWSYQWSNPYTSPPDGMPRVRAEKWEPLDGPYGRRCPPEIDAIASQGQLGDGWSIYWCCAHEPPKALSQESLARVRQNRLRRRMEKKFPLFADQFIREEMARKPDYYAGITDPAIEEARNKVLRAEAEAYAKAVAGQQEMFQS